MTKIYIVRHCEALGNVMRIFQGTTDLDISELGAKQLEFLKKRFENKKIDRVLSSPLIRARKTAEAVIGKKDIPLEILDNLIELNGGIVEGRPFIEAFNDNPELLDAWNNHPENFAPKNGEKMRDAYERIWNTLIKVVKENKNKTVVLSTHGGLTRCLNCRLLYGDIANLKNTPWAENTAVSLIEFDDKLNPNVIFYNNVSHLPKEFINKKSRIIKTIEGGKQ